MAFWVRSSRMSITFQKNFWGLVVPEPWSSKTSVDEVSPYCAEAPVAARATKRAINAAEVFYVLSVLTAFSSFFFKSDEGR